MESIRLIDEDPDGADEKAFAGLTSDCFCMVHRDSDLTPTVLDLGCQYLELNNPPRNFFRYCAVFNLRYSRFSRWLLPRGGCYSCYSVV